MTRILCVAEKPSIAKAIAGHLGGQYRTEHISGNKFIKNYQFSYTFPNWGQCQVTMTAVSGHLLSRDFDSEYTNWNLCDPIALFEANIIDSIKPEHKPISENIKRQARFADILYIWTDCDREGENIGAQIRNEACQTNPSLVQPGKTVRAYFSNTERAHIVNAAGNPIQLDEAQANAVFARQELDLRIGASFTRQLTLALQSLFGTRLREQGSKVYSYGGCQFPTLGFVVERYQRVQNFVPETFWSIKVMHQKDGMKVNFHWARNHLFDRLAVVVLFECCISAKTARVTKVQTKPTKRWRPLPLTTLELQKCGSRFLRLSSQRVLSLAEGLYQHGWISYPRTETDQFDRGMNLQGLVQRQTQGGPWAEFARGLTEGGFQWPRSGTNNDKAHPPIHPVNFVNPATLAADERRVHEFIVRRFLACCSKDATGSKTEISIRYGPEIFNTTGLVVLESNYLDVYPYDKWTSSQDLPEFREGEMFEPTEAKIHEGKTSPPGYLTEPELLALMDANGIGTDATMAEHIAKIKGRDYVLARPRGRQQNNGNEYEPDDEPAPSRGTPGRGRGRGGRGGRGGAQSRGTTSGVEEFLPTPLGIALVEGYDNMGFEISLSKPFLRKEMEANVKAVCEGRKTKEQMIDETIAQYRPVYLQTKDRMEVLLRAVRQRVLGRT
ncbi:prokaryotic type I DNA topoisomerase [Piedraia hortae CBS 480.64]|uniref:DNA topoisomerase n=1 Tax=Piedraia hortae CBS 480.64 TaxID=1314780 RepID=A0A6A7BT22_9PEZI|nr:prokaryotic type I DNA topoisomerase [Piedraia hortae CBS 480.64]